MKLITLNIWGGHVKKPLLHFIEKHNEIDIFCFQEVYHNASNSVSTEDRDVHLNIFSEIGNLLPHHHGYFKPSVKNYYGLGMFVKDTIDVLNEGDVIVYHNPDYQGQGPSHSRNLQWIECKIGNKIYSILNHHGLWNGKGKDDSQERIEQSHRIKMFLNTINAPKIICGDFNLKPNTNSLKIIADGMKNLIEENNIQSTRTSFYSKDERFADYIFTSQDIHINSFHVMNDEVSDHSPLLLDFN